MITTPLCISLPDSTLCKAGRQTESKPQTHSCRVKAGVRTEKTSLISKCHE